MTASTEAIDRLQRANEVVASADIFRVPSHKGFFINLDVVLELQKAAADAIAALSNEIESLTAQKGPA